MPGDIWRTPIYGVTDIHFQMEYNTLMSKKRVSIIPIVSRVLIGAVTFLNLQCAAYFLFSPADYAPGFEIPGVAGNAVIQGMGVLFIMWNIPYLFALVDPQRHFVSLLEAVIMQGVGVFGETAILLTLKGEHPQIHASVQRFILFDGAGFVVLLAALILIIISRRTKKAPNS
jgi:hypothetical protein